jgi:hypothetical protein
LSWLTKEGTNFFYCERETTNKLRAVEEGEFRKVYEAWEGYKNGRKGRSLIVHELGVQNFFMDYPDTPPI